nr:protein PALE CRESS, chloroplastic [Populus alba]
METKVFPLTCTPPLLPSIPFQANTRTVYFKPRSLSCCAAMRKSTAKTKEKEEQLLDGMPKEYYDEEWQAQQREKTKELERLRKQEDDEEERMVETIVKIGIRLRGILKKMFKKAKKLVSSFIRAEEEVEEKIEEAAEKGELTELVLMVIWNRLDLARRDDEKDVIRSLDLLYRRVETEILKREATPAMRLLNDLLNMHDGFNDDEWMKECRKRMIDTFPREDPLAFLLHLGLTFISMQGQ